MEKAFLNLRTNEVVFCIYEAINLSEGSPIIAGTFEETTSAWTGTFTADDGRTYEIIDGCIKEEVS